MKTQVWFGPLAVAFLIVALLPTLAFGVTGKRLINVLPDRESAARELIRWESFKLVYGQKNVDPVVDLSVTPKLDGALRDRIEAQEKERLGVLAAGKNVRPQGPLTLSQVLKAVEGGDPMEADLSNELLGLLRWIDQGRRSPLSGAALAREILVQELKRAQERAVALEAVVPEGMKRKVREVLAELLTLQKAGQAPTVLEVDQALKNAGLLAQAVGMLKPEDFPLAEWWQFAGDTRVQTRVKSPGAFMAELRQEAGARLGDVVVERQQERGITQPERPFTPSVAHIRPGQSAQPVPRSVGTDPGFQSPATGATPQNFHGDGAVVLDGPLPVSTSLTADQRARLQAERDRGQLGLSMVTGYPGSQPASCQVNIVGDPAVGPRALDDGRCEYDAITARHCVENRSGQTFDRIAISPFSAVEVTRLKTDPSGGDLTMMTFAADCQSVPMAKLSLIPPREGEPIVVHAALPLFGQASFNGSTSTTMMMNVRDPQNHGVGIEPGNSGGAVTNANGEIIGVISNKLTDPGTAGIGFFATRDALAFANGYINPSFDVASAVRRSTNRGPASVAEHTP